MTFLTIVCAVGAATAAGAFFTFSDFTTRGLRQLSSAQGAAAMQAINRAAPSPLFMLLLFGTGAACLALAVHSVLHLGDPHSSTRGLAGAIYVVGVVLTTIAYHVPRNHRLDRVDAESPEGADYWAVYLREWVRMNHVRSVAPLITAVLLVSTLVEN